MLSPSADPRKAEKGNNMQTKYSTQRTNKARFILIVLLAAVVVAGIGWMIGSAGCRAGAESATAKAWVICQPGDYVNLRSRASRNSQAVGMVDCGDMLELDGVTKNGYARVVNLTIDTPAEVWIHTGYIVFDKPEWYGDSMIVTGSGRVAARKNCEGELKRWLKPGAEVYVYWRSDEWSVTNRGFIKTIYLDVGSV